MISLKNIRPICFHVDAFLRIEPCNLPASVFQFVCFFLFKLVYCPLGFSWMKCL